MKGGCPEEPHFWGDAQKNPIFGGDAQKYPIRGVESPTLGKRTPLRLPESPQKGGMGKCTPESLPVPVEHCFNADNFRHLVFVIFICIIRQSP